MIRNVVLGRLSPDADPETRAQLDQGLAGVARLRLPGQRSMHVGYDAGLRPGGWSFAISNEWDDESSYRGYDADPEHARYRAQIVAACAEVARVQLVLPD